MPIKQLAERICRIVGFAGQIRFYSSKLDGTPRKLLDVTKMRSLGWEPKIGLEQGIKLTYDSYMSQ